MNEIVELNIHERAVAVVNGVPINEVPQDLYIPPDALEVFLEAFEGPLDLLLYLIKKQNINILDIPIAEITRQYMVYVELMKEVQLELAGEYLIMAAMLAEIKSRMMLPRIAHEEEEDDPRAELIRRLQEYERFKKAAQDIDELPRLERDLYLVHAVDCDRESRVVHPDVDLASLLYALKEVLGRAELFTHHEIKREALSVRERMSSLLQQLADVNFKLFTELFSAKEGRPGVVVTFLAMLELIKESLIEVVQTEVYGPIHVKARKS